MAPDESSVDSRAPVACRGRILLAAGVLVAAAIAVYWNSLACPFVFDDQPTIVNNPSIRHLWPLGRVLWPPSDSGGASGRPLLNLSLALNFAAGGLDVRGYHAVNLLLHALVALALFGVVRRTLAARPEPAWRPASLPVAFTAALLWTVHPLLTESVTGVVNRAELLAALFFLLTFYGFIRATDSNADRGEFETTKTPRNQEGESQESNPLASLRLGCSKKWIALSVAACLLGMASKEWMVSAPLLVFLYDRTFVAGSFRGAWRERRWLYRALAATWVVLALVMVASNHRNATVGFGLGISAWSYALTQCFAIIRYLRLAAWPQPLVLDYGHFLVPGLAAVLPQAVGLLVLLAVTGWVLVRRPAAGFLGACFFALLAPSSSVVPLVTQTVAEHRMYLPLAAVIVGAVVALRTVAGRRGLLALLALAVGLGALTARRNRDYRSEFAIWSDNVAKWPENARDQVRLGILLFDAGHVDEAVAHYREALRAEPHNPDVLNSLGHARMVQRRLPEAIDCYERALQARPDFPEVHNNLGLALAQSGRLAEAMDHYRAAIQLKPDYDKPHNNLGIALMQQGRLEAAAGQFALAVELNPDFADAQMNLGNVRFQTGRPAEAIERYRRAIQAQPDLADAHLNLAIALATEGRIREAVPECETVLRLQPGNTQARRILTRLRAEDAGGR
ncbi:MAG TPA: tetratricopeptide repeat protein [Opitutaceae bacterium]|nr:tetratricopeptide repeat protein [Opitutaceae bacterium]